MSPRRLQAQYRGGGLSKGIQAFHTMDQDTEETNFLFLQQQNHAEHIGDLSG